MAKRGRPASFNRSEALERAMELFWSRGYEATTLEDLQTAMGIINPPSFYHAFGSKEALFREAVDLYVATMGAPMLRALDEGKTARESIETMLRMAVKAHAQPGKPHGCFLLRGAITCAPSSTGAHDYVQAIRQRTPKVIKQRLDRAVANGELAQNLDTSSVAAFYATVSYGLAIRAGDGASHKALTAAVDGAMAAWDTLTSRGKIESKTRRSADSRNTSRQR